MDLERCDVCVGSGKVMGGGMIFHSCDKCLGVGKLAQSVDIVMSKDSDGYRRAKDKIKSLDDTMSDEQAEKLLDDELGIKNEKPQNKKPKSKKRGRKKSK